MNRLLKLMLYCLISALSIKSYTQDSCKTEISINTDLNSRYVWRGTQFGGNSPSIQPGISISKSNLEFGIWGAYSLGGINSGQELDLYLSYTFNKDLFTLSVTDYFFPDEALNYNYFNYEANVTGHILEGSFSFNGTDKLPLSILAAVNFFGNDSRRIQDDITSVDFNNAIGLQYSTYLELGYSIESKGTTLDLFAGCNLTSPKESNNITGYIGESAFYGSKTGIVNIGITASKEIKISESFNLPINASFISNPDSKRVFFVLGISL